MAQLGPVYVPASVVPAEAMEAASAAAAAQTRPVYAGFWLRAVAYLVDTVIVSILFGAIASFRPSAFIIFPDAGAPSGSAFPQPTLLAFVVLIPMIWIYYVMFETSSWQATPGKRVFQLYVTDVEGRPISFARATARHFGKMISGLTFLVGYLMAGFTEKKQALHDLISGCLVVRRR